VLFEVFFGFKELVFFDSHGLGPSLEEARQIGLKRLIQLLEFEHARIGIVSCFIKL